MLLWWRRRWVTGPFCRDCGITMFRALTNRTLMTGWWGAISFIVNWVTVVGNLVARRRFGRLPTPQRDQGVRGWLNVPLRPGTALIQRAGVWVAAATLAAVGVSVASQADAQRATSALEATTPSTLLPSSLSFAPTTSPSPPLTVPTEATATAATEPAVDLATLAGQCVEIVAGRLIGPVSCSAPHQGKVVAITTSSNDCPPSADGYFQDGATVACVDETSDALTLPDGLFCRDVKALGGSYEDAVDYYIRQGRPARMDKDGNGIPCETVYSVAEVQEYIAAHGTP